MKQYKAAIALLLIAACGDPTTPAPVRYNFAVIAGKHQSAVASVNTAPKEVKSMLTRDPKGTFASAVGNFFKPAVAYAQEVLNLPGEPLVGQLICGQQAKPDEPEIIPLCAFTLADGTAANTVVGKTKAGTYVLPFTAQVASEKPVEDSVTFTVMPGAAVSAVPFCGGAGCPSQVAGGYSFDLHLLLKTGVDAFGNEIDLSSKTPGYAVRANSCGYCRSASGAPEPDLNEPPTAPDATGWNVVIDPKLGGPPQYPYDGAPADYPRVTLFVFLDGNIVVRWSLAVTQ